MKINFSDRDITVSLCPTGAVPKRTDNPNVPISAQDIVSQIRECYELGITSVHLHARNDEENPVWEKKYYEDIISGIKSTVSEDLAICVTTSGRDWEDYSKRSDVLRISGDLKPDMASLTLSSLNFKKTASINSPDTILRLLENMNENGIKPELEIFDFGMINYMHYLIASDLLKPPYIVNLILGNSFSAPANFNTLGNLLSELPEESVIQVGGIAKSQFVANVLGMVSNNGIRVGLEDNIKNNRNPEHQPTNLDLLSESLKVASALGKKVMKASEFKELIRA